MKPPIGQLLSASHCWKALMTSGVSQQAEPPATVEARMPIRIFSPATPAKSAIGSQPQGVMPCKLRQLRYTSCRNSTEPEGNSYQLLQAWGWQQSMQASAILTMGTKQLQYPAPVAASGTPIAWQMQTHSGEAVSSLYPCPKLFMAVFSWMIMLATVRGGALQYSMSMSTPSRLNRLTRSTSEATKLSTLVWLPNTVPQLPFCPPTEISTFFPAAFQSAKGPEGKLTSSMMTLPSAWVLTKARMTREAPGLTSSSVDWPQKLPPNPQQQRESMFAAAALRGARGGAGDLVDADGRGEHQEECQECNHFHVMNMWC